VIKWLPNNFVKDTKPLATFTHHLFATYVT
jgi:hypothetical protein